MLTRDEALKICDTVLAHAKSAGRRRRHGVAAKLDRVARALCRQQHHHERARRRISTSPPPCGWAAGAARSPATTPSADALKRIGRGGRADRARLAGASRIRADARAARLSGGARVRGRDRRRRSSPLAPRRCRRRSRACRTAKVNGAGFHTARASATAAATANGNRRYFQIEPGRLERDRAQRRRHGLRLLRRRSLRPGAPRREAHCRTGGRQGRAIAAAESRSSPACIR